MRSVTARRAREIVSSLSIPKAPLASDDTRCFCRFQDRLYFLLVRESDLFEFDEKLFRLKIMISFIQVYTYAYIIHCVTLMRILYTYNIILLISNFFIDNANIINIWIYEYDTRIKI